MNEFSELSRKSKVLPFTFLISLVMFASIMITYRVLTNPEGYYIKSWNLLDEYGNSVEKLDGRFYKSLKEPSTFLLITEFDSSLFSGHLKGVEKYLYIPQVFCSGISIYVDGSKIHGTDFGKKFTGFFWYQPIIVELPENFSSISIEISGVYGLGIELGAYIVPHSEACKFAFLYFLMSIFLPFTVGVSFGISLILVLMTFEIKSEVKTAFLFLGTAGILSSVWLFAFFDFPFFSSVVSLLFFRKFFASLGYFSMMFFIAGISKFNPSQKKIDVIFILLNLFAGVTLLLSQNFEILERVINIAALTTFADIIYLFPKFLNLSFFAKKTPSSVRWR